MLDVKKVLSKILNWSGFRLDWSEYGTNNTTDTWIPVFSYEKIQHRVLPTNTSVNATKVGSYWTSGAIVAHRRGNCCEVKINGAVFSATSGSVVVANLPEGFRPPTETYCVGVGSGDFFVETNGDIQKRTNAALTAYKSATYPVG